MSIDEQIAVMKAFKEGKTIECKVKNDDNDPWTETKSPTWNFAVCEYRIKPEKTEIERMTNRQLSELIAKGYGEWKFNSSPTIFAYNHYLEPYDDDIVDEVLVRPWGSEKWIRPTVDIYNGFCHPRCEEDRE